MGRTRLPVSLRAGLGHDRADETDGWGCGLGRDLIETKPGAGTTYYREITLMKKMFLAIMALILLGACAYQRMPDGSYALQSIPFSTAYNAQTGQQSVGVFDPYAGAAVLPYPDQAVMMVTPTPVWAAAPWYAVPVWNAGWNGWGWYDTRGWSSADIHRIQNAQAVMMANQNIANAQRRQAMQNRSAYPAGGDGGSGRGGGGSGSGSGWSGNSGGGSGGGWSSRGGGGSSGGSGGGWGGGGGGGRHR